ncbi:hypothetical protein JAAARDRAFT_119996 [Jaapia argillacea MUCL 33604]|uniref:Uncharacterized protein n=1 Tax=Jaapia argillacea MUCL 33604 TaxID=933084 RepID=A0A067Q7F1_9AGAM|nr:hypothetical protein JAAARDRAFT_119996 [Jaapia argillacea MUCL 33604]
MISSSASSSSQTCSHSSSPSPISSMPVSTHSTTHGQESWVNQNAPQCCHCGWRGAHSPSCPFK